MKAVLNLKQSLLLATIIVAGTSFSSCSDDDDNNGQKPISLNDVNGSYQGKMYVGDMEDPEGANVVAVVEEQKISFSAFPVNSILVAIEGEEVASEVIEKLDDVPYEVTFMSEINEAKDRIVLSFNPEPLLFSYVVTDGEGEATTKQVEVFLTTSEVEGIYKSKKLEIELTAEQINVDEEQVESFDSQRMIFEFDKE